MCGGQRDPDCYCDGAGDAEERGFQRGAAMQASWDSQTLANVIDVLEVYRPHLTDPDCCPDWRTILEDIYEAAGVPLEGGASR